MRMISGEALEEVRQRTLTSEELARGRYFLAVKHDDITHIDDVLGIVERDYIPLFAKVLAEIGCQCVDNVLYTSRNEVWEIVREVFANHLEWVRREQKMPQWADEQLALGYAQLNEMLDLQKRCHPKSEGFICYCDEHPH